MTLTKKVVQSRENLVGSYKEQCVTSIFNLLLRNYFTNSWIPWSDTSGESAHSRIVLAGSENFVSSWRYYLCYAQQLAIVMLLYYSTFIAYKFCVDTVPPSFPSANIHQVKMRLNFFKTRRVGPWHKRVVAYYDNLSLRTFSDKFKLLHWKLHWPCLWFVLSSELLNNLINQIMVVQNSYLWTGIPYSAAINTRAVANIIFCLLYCPFGSMQ